MLLHHLTSVLVTALSLCASASAASIPNAVGVTTKRAIPESHVLHERHEPHWGRHWNKRDKVPHKTLLPMRIGLKQSDDTLRRGHEKLMDLSDRGSPNYGKHMTAEEVIDFFAPSSESIDNVIDWVTSTGINRDRISLSANKQWIQFDALVEEAEELLFTEYFIWEHGSSGSTDISCEEYHVPSHVQEHIDYVMPGIRLRQRNNKRATTKATDPKAVKRDSRTSLRSRADGDVFTSLPPINSTSCDTYIVPECIKVQYGIPNGTTAYSGNQLGIYESDNQHYSTADLDQYWGALYPAIPQGTYPQNRLIDGAVGPAAPSSIPIGAEADLDFEVAWPLIWPQQTVLFQVDDQNYEQEETNSFGPSPAGSYNTFLDALDGSYCTYSAYGETGDCTDSACEDPQYPDTEGAVGAYQGQLQCGVYSPTSVISMSYELPEDYLPAYYMERQCNEWMKLGLQGVTVVVASGDHGVGDYNTCLGNGRTIFTPYYMSTCPYVLSVGATELDLPPGQTTPSPYEQLYERATTSFPSGGGFSNIFPQPSYQQAAVQEYFNTAQLPFTGYTGFVNQSDVSNITSGVYNLGGRGYPDVSAVGDRFLEAYNGSWLVNGGTSMATPIWASIITLINEARLAAGMSTVGFINPTLYANPQVFNDITDGANPGCNSSGFPAAVGWDPVTGLGSPNYTELYNLFV